MKKYKKDSIAILIAVALVFVYIFYQCYSVTHIDLETQTALTSTVYEKIDAEALIIRQEQLVDNPSTGVTLPCIDDGDKINNGGNVAMVFSSNEAAENYSRYSEISRQLEYYEDLESQSMGQAANVESIDNEIGEDINEYIRTVSSKSPTDVSEKGESVNDSLIRRQMIIGKSVDFASVTKELRSEQQALAESASKPDRYITTDASGVFTSYTDGYENLVDYDKVGDLTVKQLNEYLKQVNDEPQKKTGALGKLVTGYNWYFAVVISADEAEQISDGDRVEIALKDNNDTVINAVIVSGADPDAGVKQSVLLLKCNNMDTRIAARRSENIEIRYGSYTGVKVPVDAVHVVDGKKGVYALISSQVKFREAEILYTGDDYVLLSYDPDSDNGIRLYDKIITQGKDLEDGKVYT